MALRVLSTAAIMSIVASIATPAFAGVYYINEGSIDVTVNENGEVEVKQNGKTYTDKNEEVIIRGGSSTDYKDGRNDRVEKTTTAESEEQATIGESEPIEQETAEPVAEEKIGAEDEPQDAPEAEEGEEPEEQLKEKAEDEAEAEKDAPEAETSEEKEQQEEVSDVAAQETAETTAPVEEDTAQTAAKRTAPDTSMTQDTSVYTPEKPKSETTGGEIKETSNVISIVNNWLEKNFKFTLENVNIKNNKSTNIDKAAMSIKGKGNTTIELDGDNVLSTGGSRYGTSNSHATIEKNGDKNETGTLTITDTNPTQNEDGTVNTRGSLTVTGDYGTAIGGDQGHSGENITIEGNAYVKASGKDVGIGGGRAIYDQNGQDGNNITIGGNAYVVAKGSSRAIGGSGVTGEKNNKPVGGNGNNIHITGTSTVYADGGIGGAGGSTWKGGNAENLVIDGESTVYASCRDGSNSAGDNNGGNVIGSGYTGTTDIHIGGKAKVKAWFTGNSYNGVGIGSHGGTSTITIGGDAIIGDGSDGIGSSGGHDASTTIAIQDNATVGKLKQGALIGSTISSGTNVTGTADITLKNNAIVKSVAKIGSKTLKSVVKIFDNVSIDEITGDRGAIGSHYDHSDITIGGSSAAGEKQNGTVTISATGGSDSVIGAGWSTEADVKIGGNVDLKLKSSNGKYIIKANGTTYTAYTDAELQEMLKNAGAEDSTITLVDKDDKILRIIHSTDLCEPAKDNDGNDILIDYEASTCTKQGHKTYLCSYEKNHGATQEGASHGNHTETLPLDPNNHAGHGTKTINVEPATCTTAGYSGDVVCDGCNGLITAGHTIDALGHDWGEWIVTKEATCTEEGSKERVCKRDPNHIDSDTIAAKGHTPTVIGKKEPTCEEPGYTGDEVCDKCGTVVKKGEAIPATGKPADPSQPTNPETPDQPANPDDNNNNHPAVQEGDHVTAPELDVLSEYGVHQFFTVSQNGSERTYTSNYDCGTLTGIMSTLAYLQEEGTDTIVFTTNQRTSCFAVADLLALVNEGDTFYLRHTGAEEPTLLVIESDHSEVLGG